MDDRLVCLIYHSRAKPALCEDGAALGELLHRARDRNASQDITGTLFLAQGRVMQYLEGARAEVNVLYNQIARDERHSDVTLIDFSEIEVRKFREWGMTSLPDEFLMEISESCGGKFRPERFSAEAAHFLVDFAARLLSPEGEFRVY